MKVCTPVLPASYSTRQVRYFERGENMYVATDIDAGKAITFVLNNLKQNVQYELRVYGYSRGGWGLQSSPTLEFILGMLEFIPGIYAEA